MYIYIGGDKRIPASIYATNRVIYRCTHCGFYIYIYVVRTVVRRSDRARILLRGVLTGPETRTVCDTLTTDI